jgi:26S proteasome regulatory subunit N8
VGVEHLLRDINDPSVSTTAGELRHKLAGLRGLRTHLGEVLGYLDAVTAGRLPANREILYHVQTLLARLPNTQLPAVVASTYETVNDQHLVIYMASLTRTVLALHDLLVNKQRFKAAEDEEGKAAKAPVVDDKAADAKGAAKKSA